MIKKCHQSQPLELSNESQCAVEKNGHQLNHTVCACLNHARNIVSYGLALGHVNIRLARILGS
jgi:hypothetical protein